ncbi:hypothetical protein D3C85_1546110 [compost metagenome]
MGRRQNSRGLLRDSVYSMSRLKLDELGPNIVSNCISRILGRLVLENNRRHDVLRPIKQYFEAVEALLGVNQVRKRNEGAWPVHMGRKPRYNLEHPPISVPGVCALLGKEFHSV